MWSELTTFQRSFAVGVGVCISLRLADRYAPLWVSLLLTTAYMAVATTCALMVLSRVWFPDVHPDFHAPVDWTIAVGLTMIVVRLPLMLLHEALAEINAARAKNTKPLTMWQCLTTRPKLE